MVLNQKDDNTILVPTIFIFVPRMSVVVNQNIYQSLKLVNKAGYTAINIVFDRTYPGYRVNTDTVFHFGPPADILLMSETTKDFHFVSILPGTILLTPISTPILYQRKRV